MIPFFVGYGVVMCVLAFRWRRRPHGAVVVALGSLLLLSLGLGYMRLAEWASVGGARAVVTILYAPYTLLVTGISVWFVSLPRDSGRTNRCGNCGYDVSGLVGRTVLCPECGQHFAGYASMARSIGAYQRQKWRHRSAASKPPHAPDREHAGGQAEHQAPPHPAER